MEVTKTAAIAGMEISEIESRIDEKQLKQLMEKIRRAKKIYVWCRQITVDATLLCNASDACRL
ncbi:MAG: hypothetical protein ACLRL6_03575 [Clostridium sp.]